jgi:pyruvate,water dikinase
MKSSKYVMFFEEIGIEDVPVVGGKNASLGEMYQKLSHKGVRVPNGFATTADAYRYALEQTGAVKLLHEALDDLNPSDVKDLARRAKQAREIVYGAGLPDDFAAEIIAGYRQLQQEYGEDVRLAVRSSATAEDLPTASFAGQQETFLNVHGEESLLDACRRCFASLFTDRAIHYRVDQGFDHFDVALSIGVMKMVRSDLASSGVMFTLDTESGFRDVVFVTGAYGLGENVVQGAVDPDEFYVHKPMLAQGHRAVLRRLLGDKAVKMIFVEGRQGARHATSRHRRMTGLGSACPTRTSWSWPTMRHHRSALHKPMDMEWAKDGRRKDLHRPGPARDGGVTAPSERVRELRPRRPWRDIVEGRSVGEKIASGTETVIDSVAHLSEFQPGEVLVADTTTPDWEPVMKTASASSPTAADVRATRRSSPANSASPPSSAPGTRRRSCRAARWSPSRAPRATRAACIAERWAFTSSAAMWEIWRVPRQRS